jgi:D-alanine-D-alanine ligase
MTAKSVAVLMGGVSSEREVSLDSGREVLAALGEAGYDVRGIEVGAEVAALVQALTPAPDVVFNALHGRFGEDGKIQGLLDLLGIPYTHSGVLASALAMDKPMAKRLFADAGIRCAEHVVAPLGEAAKGKAMRPPCVVKPLNEGSSVDVHIVYEKADFAGLLAEDGDADRPVMVERYVAGREITVAVMGDRALGVTEIRPNNGFYDYRAKYTAGRANHLVPAPLPPAAYAQALDDALAAHRTLGCRGVTRADMRYDDTKGEPGTLYLLEVNTQPGMTKLSLVPELAAHAGIGFTELVVWMLENAACDR